MRLAALLALSAIPLVATFTERSPSDPAFGISCGTGIAGEPGVLTLEAGPRAPRTIQVRIAASRTTSAATVSGIQVAAGRQSGSCTSDTGGPYNVYLNSSDAASVALVVDSPDTVLIRGLRGGREWSTVTIVPGAWVDARLTW